LGATVNDLFLISAPGIQWFERILALTNCLVWFVNIFVLASIANLIVAALSRLLILINSFEANMFTDVDWWIILSFSSVMIFPVIYYICIVFWLPPTLFQKLQYLLGMVMYLICGPFINIIVLVYSLYNMDSFGWGKTRKVVSEENDEKGGENDEESQIGLERVV
jgi:chitin synthase